MSLLGVLERLLFGDLLIKEQRDLRMCPFQENGWEIQNEKGLISHHSGFRAEFRNATIYSIKQFPYEATIHDIRNWVMKAESLLSRTRPDSSNNL